MKRTYWHSDRLTTNYNPEVPEVRVQVSSKSNANLISSRVQTAEGVDLVFHMPTIDIDHKCHLRESETPGHYHLLIDVPMSWSQYTRLLDVMTEVGIVEEGYFNATIERGQSFLALAPWKEDAE